MRLLEMMRGMDSRKRKKKLSFLYHLDLPCYYNKNGLCGPSVSVIQLLIDQADPKQLLHYELYILFCNSFTSTYSFQLSTWAKYYVN